MHLANHCRFANGNVHAAVDLACAQVANGHEVFFGSSGGDFEDFLKEAGVTHIYIPQDKRGIGEVLKALWILDRTNAKRRFDIVHAHMMTGAVIGYLCTRLRRTKLITTVHNAFERHAIIMGLGDRVIAVSQAVANIMAKRGVSIKKLRVVLNGTLGALRRKNDSKIPAVVSHPSLVTLCGLHHRKGVQDLIAAFDVVSQKHTNANLYIVGDGPDRQVYEHQASQLKHADRVHFIGALRDPNPYLLAADIFILASLQDPCPLVIPEAREAGCAIVATNVDGIPEILKVGDAGVMVPPEDPQSLAKAIIGLLEDEDRLLALKRASFNQLEYFDINRVMKETMTIYERCP